MSLFKIPENKTRFNILYHITTGWQHLLKPFRIEVSPSQNRIYFLDNEITIFVNEPPGLKTFKFKELLFEDLK